MRLGCRHPRVSGRGKDAPLAGRLVARSGHMIAANWRWVQLTGLMSQSWMGWMKAKYSALPNQSGLICRERQSRKARQPLAVPCKAANIFDDEIAARAMARAIVPTIRPGKTTTDRPRCCLGFGSRDGSAAVMHGLDRLPDISLRRRSGDRRWARIDGRREIQAAFTSILRSCCLASADFGSLIFRTPSFMEASILPASTLAGRRNERLNSPKLRSCR